MAAMQTTKTLSIRECGHDEAWLRDMIYEDPSILKLGDLRAVMKEKTQAQGGRLDLLLNDPEDDSMYEVELQLGATDESHIIRTIEYWENERRRWPNRSHTAVLVAEGISTRFFNVVQLLSKAVPIIGVQVNVIQVENTTALHFAKMIDTYEEPEPEPTPQQSYDEKHWVDAYPWTLEIAQRYKDLLGQLYGQIPTKYFESYISLTVGGIARAWVSRRKKDRALIELKYVEEDMATAIDYLRKEGVAFKQRGDRYLTFNVNLSQLNEKLAAHEWLTRRLAPQSLTKPQGE